MCNIMEVADAAQVIVNGYAFKLENGKVVPDMKANLKGIANITDTTKAVAVKMAKEQKAETELGVGL